MANLTFNPSLMRDRMNQIQIEDLYKNAPKRRRQNIASTIADPLQVQPEGRVEKWTYQLLAESKPLSRFVSMVVRDFRALFERFYSKSSVHIRHEIEWCVMMDNSGSLSPRINQCAEALVVVLEVLRKLECRFAVARFGGLKSQKLLKKLDEPFSHARGEQILESFTYDEGTYPATALQAVCDTVWKPSTTIADENVVRHRIVLMVTDGLTTESQESDWKEVIERLGLHLSVLLLSRSHGQGGRVQLVDALLSAITDCFTVLDPTQADNLPVCLADLMTKQFEKILLSLESSTSQNDGTSKTTFQVTAPVVPKTSNATSHLAVHKIVGNIDLSKAFKDGAGARPQLMYQTSGPNQPIPFIEELHKRGVSSKVDDQRFDSNVLKAVNKYYQDLLQTRAFDVPEKIYEADKSWAAAELTLSRTVDELSAVFEDLVFPNNKYTRKRADFKGTSLYLPGLIKAVITDFNYKKYFSTRTAGGKRNYSVVLAVDTSLSMSGHLGDCAVETLVCFISALHRLGIETYSVLCFGTEVKIIKPEDRPWDAATAYTLLQALRFESTATLDADGISVAAQLLAKSSSRGPKKMFVFTDGYSSAGLRLTQSLQQAEEQGIEVTAIAVGFEKTFVPKCYPRFIVAALPSAVCTALRALYQNQESITEDTDWQDLAPSKASGHDSIDSILQNRSKAFPDLAAKLREDREQHIIPGSKPSKVSVDVAFCLDCTGSMSAWIAAAKAQIAGIVSGLKPAINKQYPDVEVDFRFAVVVYRDHGELGHLDHIRFTDDQNAVVQFVQSQQATGGADGPEDVLGALNAAASWTDWSGKAKILVLIGDSPAHGRDCTDDPTDRYPNGEPHGLTVPAVMQDLISKDIDLMFCRIKRDYTQMMEAQFKMHFKNEEKGKELKSVDLFDGSSKEMRRFHFIFVLDESGSMSGAPWNDLMLAYRQFLQRRLNDQGVEDLVTVVQFSSTPRTTVNCSKLSVAPQSLSFGSGGTCFSPALVQASTHIGQSPEGCIPMMIFMSDGGDAGGSTSVATMQAVYNAHAAKGLICHTVAFGSGAETGLLRDIATAGHGTAYSAANGMQLGQVFSEIAAGCSALDGLVQMFGELVSNMIVNKIVVDYL
eukprot:GILK01015097.1.p1 GENE.GILK01015097.1~~GILK01015097.1.p1  ORF type:complete len:1309 (+),score=173.68 GILK01015097.1:591-3929(+)